MIAPLRFLLTAALSSTISLVVGQAGTLDPTFGTEGHVTFTLNNENVYGADALVLPDGRILGVTGVYNPTSDIAVQRYNADGTLDDTFGDAGVVTIDVNDGSEEQPSDAFLQADGKIVIVGRMDGALLVMRLLEDGSLDTGFDEDGWAMHDVAAGEQDYVGDCVVRPTGEVVVTCNNLNAGGYSSVVQFTATGGLDPAFGTNGVLTVNNVGGSGSVWLYDIELSSSGTIHLLARATVDPNSTDNIHVYRITPAGTLDLDFDGDGARRVPIGVDDDNPSALAVLPDGKLLVAGATNMAGLDHPFVARLNADGTFDTAFGDGGVHIMMDILGQFVNDLLVRPNGQVVFSGEAGNGVGTDMLIGRLNADGSFDTTFGTDGTTRTQIEAIGTFEHGSTLALAPDGNYIMRGTTGVAPAGTLSQVILKYRSGSTTGIAEAAPLRAHLAPVPTRGPCTLTFPVAHEALRIRVLNALGQAVQEHAAAANTTALQLDLGDLATGSYMLLVEEVKSGRRSAQRVVRE